MLNNFLKEIIEEYRNDITLNDLGSRISDKNSKSFLKTIRKSELFKLSGNITFLKKSLIETKNTILKELEEYIKSRVFDDNLKRSLISLYTLFIPEELYLEWNSLNIENRIVIYDLLFNFFIKGKSRSDKLKRYFNSLIEIYALLTVYSMLLVKSEREDFEKTTNYMEQVERFEETLYKRVFQILSYPENILKDMPAYEQELVSITDGIDRMMQISFDNAIGYSQTLFKKIIRNELKRFEFIYLLSRFDFESFFEWIIVLSEESDPGVNENLFKDLGL